MLKPTIVVDFTRFTCSRELVDSTKVIDEIYYRSTKGPIPAAFCFKAEHEEAIKGILEQMKQAKTEFDINQYKTQMFLRKNYSA